MEVRQMKIEHVALFVQDPVSVARWYEEHLGLRLVRSSDQRPSLTRFLADSEGTTVLEIYAGTLPVPDYRAMDPLLLHVAFATNDLPATRDRLLAAGATAEGDITVTPAGDRLAMLRDPWGLALQLAHRATPLVGTRS
jgi:catechol 2,3-dioxygenase-like lactoylglutathione lyase family enzyme